MKTYIVRYAPLNSYGHVIQDIKIVKILSESEDINYIESEFKKKCDLANVDLKNYKGMMIAIETLEKYLDGLPSDVI